MAELLDRATHASIAKLTLGLSPTSLIGAYLDWATHLAASPGKRLQLAEKSWRKWMRLQQFAARCAFEPPGIAPCVTPLPQDKRFSSPAWGKWPFSVYAQSHLLAQQWWHVATTGVPGVSIQHQRMLEFTARQVLDVFAPSNFIMTNPDVLDRTLRENGHNLVRGWQHFAEDWDRLQGGRPPVGAEAYAPGCDVAITPGKVVLRNELVELIQYLPSTGQVRPEPVLVVPAWIMKYYILDLSPRNSLIKYSSTAATRSLRSRGRILSPPARHLARRLPPSRHYGSPRRYFRHRARYQVDVRDTVWAVPLGDRRRGPGAQRLLALATLSFLAARSILPSPGELQLFINESQLRFLEDMMWEQGFLDAKQMAGAFQLLRSNDLVWSRVMREYLLGERTPMTDMMAWNANFHAPALPHALGIPAAALPRQRTRRRPLQGGRAADHHPDIRQPLFCVGTLSDHVAPWRSVYKWTQLADTEVTFALTTGGHNAGIVSEPGHGNRSYRIATYHEADMHPDAETWMAEVPVREGSWWPAWVEWLAARSGQPVRPPPMGSPACGYAPVCDAPGQYVLEA